MWRVYYDKLSNEATIWTIWNKSGFTGGDAVCGPSEKISLEEVRVAVAKMKCMMAGGPSGVVT